MTDVSNKPGSDRDARVAGALPTVTIVFLVYNRRVELRESLHRMLEESDYPAELVEVIVVDNASTDGVAEMLRADYPQVNLIVRELNIGVSGWNEGLQAASGEYVLALDDDCYLAPEGLRSAVAAAETTGSDMVSFRVVSTFDPDHVFTEAYQTGLFMFWGCAVLMRRRVVQALGGYDPEIFVWANELEFTMRFFDRGFRHLHLPEVDALHMKHVPPPGGPDIEARSYKINGRHWGYIVAKLMGPRDAGEALVALLSHALRDGLRIHPNAFGAFPEIFRGFVHGLRHRDPLHNSQIAPFYRRNFLTFASPWWLSRHPKELVRTLPRELFTKPRRRGLMGSGGPSQRDGFLESRELFYGRRAATLEFSPAPKAAPIVASEAMSLNG